MKTSKKEIYAAYGIKFESGKIEAPEFGFIPPLLINGNEKIGHGVYHFSTLPTNQEFNVIINNKSFTIPGTCPCYCKGCYATKGNYNYPDIKIGLAIKTILVRRYPEFVIAAINAQIKADRVELLRIHASGDFDITNIKCSEIDIWRNVAINNPGVKIWSYTKVKSAENAFDDIANINIVKSVISGCGFNFGHCDYILNTFKKLKANNESVYICRCGIDKNQHCVNCTGCSKNKYVLFVEHSTGYKAEKDACFEELKSVIENQPAQKD